jgi:hypothetical protein
VIHYQNMKVTCNCINRSKENKLLFNFLNIKYVQQYYLTKGGKPSFSAYRIQAK